ncbi:WD repeat-containing protein 44 [Camellia lanceoleosa]|uniref:WD repeat-containing protein 44 n=1 Tax=Camellia lanceoleosa TaxID=1840588 RepID=A0ACC0GDJ8_9ERIC|nr:WD repeat-containing protein 44 [Camellia lanceoleosa]
MTQDHKQGSAMDHQDQKKGATMERKKTMTMNWDGLGDDDDDCFFETFDRLSSAISLDLASSGSEDDEFDDSRMSFTSTISQAAIDDLRGFETANRGPASIFGDYDMWMAEPGSIKDRRRQLLQGQYANTAPQRVRRNRSLIPNSGALPDMLSDGQFRAFFLIKNLDTGKEFIVKEFNNEGMWNRLSEVETGKQLSMEEFEKTVGHSPVVKELLHRENVSTDDGKKGGANAGNSYLTKSFRNSKRRGVAFLKNIRCVANSMSGLIGDKERDTADQQNPSSKWIKVRQHGKSMKEFTALHLCQEIQAHDGSIWTMKFSPDAHYLATAGEDRVIHVWEVQECEVMSAKPLDEWSSTGSTPLHPMAGNILEQQPPLAESSPMPSERKKEKPPLPEISPMPSERKKKGKSSNKKKGNSIPDYVNVPETVFSLSEKPVCTFTGHQDDVLDLSWSKSQLLLSASMDKTVRLWDMETKSCLKLFAHNDYVTCIQFNPIDDNYFISGSLDAKVRIWKIPDRQLVDYTDLHEMVTAVCYTPDGQGALIGSHKGSCRLYSTADCSLEQKEEIDIQQKKKTQAKKITGFQVILFFS